MLSLSLHPDSRSPVRQIEVEVAREASGLVRLTYHISGAIDRMAVPPGQSSARADELWKHTCFEAFLGATDGYYEFNLSPSLQWAAYRFDGYRAGMREVETQAPTIAWEWGAEQGRLSATIQLPQDVTGQLGLSVIIEDRDGSRSFWALAHAAGAPDFHNDACFTAELPPAG